MPSHAAKALLSERALPDGRLEVVLLLACGCSVRRTVEPDRIAVDTLGKRFAVGKYPCPQGHPVSAR